MPVSRRRRRGVARDFPCRPTLPERIAVSPGRADENPAGTRGGAAPRTGRSSRRPTPQGPRGATSATACSRASRSTGSSRRRRSPGEHRRRQAWHGADQSGRTKIDPPPHRLSGDDLRLPPEKDFTRSPCVARSPAPHRHPAGRHALSSSSHALWRHHHEAWIQKRPSLVMNSRASWSGMTSRPKGPGLPQASRRHHGT